MTQGRETHGGCPMVNVVQVPIERVTVYLNGHDILGGRMHGAARFLETFEYAFAILVWVLFSGEVNVNTNAHHNCTRGLTALALSPSSLPSLPSAPTPALPSPSPSSRPPSTTTNGSPHALPSPDAASFLSNLAPCNAALVINVRTHPPQTSNTLTPCNVPIINVIAANCARLSEIESSYTEKAWT